MRFELKVAIRFLKEGRGQTLFIILAIAVGVSVQVFLNTLISGVQMNLVNETVGKSSHIWITEQSQYEAAINKNINDNYAQGNYEESNKTLRDWENIIAKLEKRSDLKAIVPVVEGNGFIIETQEAIPIFIKGMDLEAADGIYGISESIVGGVPEIGGNSILIGSGIAEAYKLNVGDFIMLTLASGKAQNYAIGGIFELGSATDNSWIILSLNQAQKFLNVNDSISKIEIQVNDVFDAQNIGGEISKSTLDVNVDNWIENNSSLLSALSSQSMSSTIIQVFVLFSITLGIASVLAVSVVQKSKQIGILKAMGTKDKQVRDIFLMQGAMMGTIGAVSGAILGIAMINLFLWGTSIPTGEPIFPLTIVWSTIGGIVVIVIISSIIAAVLPARNSLKLNPVEVIRNG